RGAGALHGSVVAARAFHRHQEIVEGVLLAGVPDLCHGRLQRGAVMLDDRGRYADVAVEVAEHPLGAGLGTIDADDAEVLGSDLLDARVNDAGRLLQDLARTGPRPFPSSCSGHVDTPPEEGLGITQFSWMAVQKCSFFLERTYQRSWRGSQAPLARRRAAPRGCRRRPPPSPPRPSGARPFR